MVDVKPLILSCGQARPFFREGEQSQFFMRPNMYYKAKITTLSQNVKQESRGVKLFFWSSRMGIYRLQMAFNCRTAVMTSANIWWSCPGSR